MFLTVLTKPETSSYNMDLILGTIMYCNIDSIDQFDKLILKWPMAK